MSWRTILGMGVASSRSGGRGGRVLNPKLASDSFQRRIICRLSDSFVDWIVLKFSNVDEK